MINDINLLAFNAIQIRCQSARLEYVNAKNNALIKDDMPVSFDYNCLHTFAMHI